MPDNRDAWDLWQAAKTQWRVGMGGLVGIDYTAVRQIAVVLDIDMTPALLYKLRELESYTLQYCMKKEADNHGGK
jgi:hypothetical protein